MAIAVGRDNYVSALSMATPDLVYRAMYEVAVTQKGSLIRGKVASENFLL